MRSQVDYLIDYMTSLEVSLQIKSVKKVLFFVMIGLLLLSQASCANRRETAKEAMLPAGSAPESIDETIKQEAYSANLIAKSDNSLSSQEKEMVLKEISDELDYIMNVVQSLELTDTYSDDEAELREALGDSNDSP